MEQHIDFSTPRINQQKTIVFVPGKEGQTVRLYSAEWAYHVTCIESEKKYEFYDKLICGSADDPVYDAHLLNLDVVFFTTTLREGKLPMYSPYPISAKHKQQFKRVKVPLSRFDTYSMWFCEVEKDEQIRIVLAEKKRGERLFGSEMNPVYGFKKMNPSNNPYLLRAKVDGKIRWFTNEYNAAVKQFVNFVVLEDVPLGNDCEWDTVKRNKFGEGTPVTPESDRNRIWKLERLVEQLSEEIKQLRSQIAQPSDSETQT